MNMAGRKTRTIAINAYLADMVAKAAIDRRIAQDDGKTINALVEAALQDELRRAKTARAHGGLVATRPLFQPAGNVPERFLRRIALSDALADQVKEEAVQRQLEQHCTVSMRQVTESALQTFLQLPDLQATTS